MSTVPFIAPGKQWIVAIDPGRVNFAFIIEEIDSEMIKSVVCPSKRERFVKSDPTEPYLQFLERFYHCGRTVLCVNSDVSDVCGDSL